VLWVSMALALVASFPRNGLQGMPQASAKADSHPHTGTQSEKNSAKDRSPFVTIQVKDLVGRRAGDRSIVLEEDEISIPIIAGFQIKVHLSHHGQ